MRKYIVSIHKQQIHLAQKFYIRESQSILEFFQYTQGWLLYSQIFQQEVDLNHVHSCKSVNISKLEK